MKKFSFWPVCIALCFFAINGLILVTGCTKKPAASTGTTPNLQIAINQGPNVSRFRPNYLTEYLEQMNNVSLNFYVLPNDRGESRTKLALMASSNDLPETIWDGGLSSARDQIHEWGRLGLLIPLNKYFEDSALMPNFNKLPEDVRKTMLAGLIMADGNIYGFPRYEPQSWNMTPYRMFINKAWIDKLGLQMPGTTDELRNVLIAFRDGDPNGNGKSDEIGIWGTVPNAWYGEEIINCLINSFVYMNKWHLLGIDAAGNNVIAPFTQNAFRNALKYLNSLYKDGVLDAGTFTADTQSFRAVLNASPPVVGLTSMGSLNNYPNADNNPNFLQMALMAPLSSPDSPGYTVYNPPAGEPMVFITNTAKNVELIVRFIDSFYDKNVSIIVKDGEENVDWTRDPAMLTGVTNVFVEQGMYSGITTAAITDVWSVPQNKHWGNINPRYSSLEANETGANLSNPYAPGQPSQIVNAQNLQLYMSRHPKYIFPENPAYNSVEASVASRIKTEIDTYLKTSIAEFTIGTRDIASDAAWNVYLRDMDNMGLQDWIKVAQNAWNRGSKPQY